MKKVMLWSGAGLLILILVLCLWPEKQVADADLQVSRKEVPRAENAFYVLENARGSLSKSGVNKADVSSMLEAKDLDSKRAAEVLADNEEALASFDEAMKLPHLQAPEVKTFDDLLPYLAPWKTLAQLALIRAEVQLRAGDSAGFLHSALGVVDFGQRVQNSGGTIINYLVGASIKALAAKRLRARAGEIDDPAELQWCIRELSKYPASTPALTNVFKIEYRLQVDAIAKMKRGTMPGTNPRTGERVAVSAMSTVLMNESETQELFARFARTCLQGLPHTYNQMPTNSLPTWPRNAGGVFVKAMSGNIMGEVLGGMLLPALQKIMERKCRENVDIAATQVMLALRCHQLRYGKLPPSLDQLTPEFLSAPAIDDFDGRPLRYSAEEKIVYSVGADSNDSGGLEKAPDGTRLDMVYPVEF